MLRPAAGLSLCLALALVKSGRGEAGKCPIALAEWRVSSQSIHLQWSTSGALCNFTLTCRSDNASHPDCQPVQTANRSYECSYSGLEAGTLYHLRIFSLSDTESSDISLQTENHRIIKLE